VWENLAWGFPVNQKRILNMATYAEIQSQILRLQQEAETLRKNETAAVIEEIKGKIVQYGLSARDLGLDGSARRTRKGKPREGAATARFIGPNGQTWSGYGRQPQWMRDALAAGKSKEDFAA
jgi:DNA-binding protein H-NS